MSYDLYAFFLLYVSTISHSLTIRENASVKFELTFHVDLHLWSLHYEHVF